MIQPSPTAAVGSVTTLRSYSPLNFSPSDAVLCRNTAPLISFGLGALRRRLGVRIAGRDLAKSLLDEIEKTNAATVAELSACLTSRCSAALRRADKSENAELAATIVDKFAALRALVAGHTSVAAVVATITRLFAPGQGLLTLSTIHRSKGLEWPKVFFLDPHLLPSPWATQSWQRRQETNLCYVAITRAKLDLVYIRSDNWKRES